MKTTLQNCLIMMLLMGLTHLGFAAGKITPAPKPNILLIFADDLSPEYFGSYGGTKTPTPNVDRMGERGLVFENAWITPMCGPSRAMVITGSYATRTGIWHNALNVRIDGNDPHHFALYHPTLAKVMKSAGYVTAISGKPHELGGQPSSPEVGFDEYCLHELNIKNLPAGAVFDGDWETRESLPGWGNPVTSRYWHPCIVQNGKLLDTKPEDYGDDIHADFLLDFMKRQSDAGKPAFGFFTMNLPHSIAKVGIPEQPTTPLSGRPGKLTGGTFEECVQYVDDLVGRIQKGLEERGLTENTIVIFTTDNGDQMNGKGSLTELGARVPLVIDGPAPWVTLRGTTPALTSLADLLPTLAAWGGAEVPSTDVIDGVSFAGLMDKTAPAPREYLYSYLGTGRLIRDQDWCLEAVDPMVGLPVGRLYRYNSDGSRTLIAAGSTNADAIAARVRLMGYLEEIPHLDTSLPHVAEALEKYENAPHRHRPALPWDSGKKLMRSASKSH
jgi:arylsulfatase A